MPVVVDHKLHVRETLQWNMCTALWVISGGLFHIQEVRLFLSPQNVSFFPYYYTEWSRIFLHGDSIHLVLILT